MASRMQLQLFQICARIFPKARYDEEVAGREVDIYIPELMLAIEYDGVLYHSQGAERDERKNKELVRAGLSVIRIRDAKLPKLNYCTTIEDGPMAIPGLLAVLLMNYPNSLMYIKPYYLGDAKLSGSLNEVVNDGTSTPGMLFVSFLKNAYGPAVAAVPGEKEIMCLRDGGKELLVRSSHCAPIFKEYCHQHRIVHTMADVLDELEYSRCVEKRSTSRRLWSGSDSVNTRVYALKLSSVEEAYGIKQVEWLDFLPLDK